MATKKKLTRSNRDKVLSGLLGGVAEYFDVDTAILRLGYLGVTIFTGFVPGVVFYFLAVFVVPLRSK